ncbi:MAG TPA: hypothetical protein VFV10_10270 [Gammaproteobacteria bacterium]|nr:hypothetical protein [Gammaproteobacteria bacterium]
MAVEIGFPPATARAAPRRESPSPIEVLKPTVAAFLGRAERGPVNEPIVITSLDDYRKVFGGHCGFGFLSHAVHHYFMNGGTHAIVVRLVNGARRAEIDVPAGDGFLRLRARRPGSAEHLRVSVDYDGLEREGPRFNLVVQRVSRPGSSLVEDQELYPALSMSSDDARFVVDALKDSKLVALLGPLPSQRPDATSPAHPGQAIPYVDCTRPGSDGEELTDYDIVGSNREGTGLFALDRAERIDFLCLPPPPGRDLGTTTFVAAERYCERRRALLIWDPPWAWRTADAALLGVRAAGLTSPNTLTYFPRLRPRAELGRFPHGLPASGALAGLLAAAARDGVWRSDADVRLSTALSTAADVGPKEGARLHRFGVNTLSRGPGGNVRLHGRVCLEPSRTVPAAWGLLDLRRTVLFVLGSIERATQWMTRASIDAAACARLVEQVRDFFAELHGRGAFPAAKAEQAFFLRVTRRHAAGPDAVVTLRFGFAPLDAGRFEVYEIDYGAGFAKTRAVPPLEGSVSDRPSR